jgi:hypothetical protein
MIDKEFKSFAGGMLEGMSRRPARSKVFDWNKAVALIKEHGIKNAWAGLAEDWGYTSGRILIDGKPVAREETYTYLASHWATPALEDIMRIEGGLYECWMWKDETEWDAHTYWPESAVKLLTEEKESPIETTDTQGEETK